MGKKDSSMKRPKTPSRPSDLDQDLAPHFVASRIHALDRPRFLPPESKDKLLKLHHSDPQFYASVGQSMDRHQVRIFDLRTGTLKMDYLPAAGGGKQGVDALKE